MNSARVVFIAICLIVLAVGVFAAPSNADEQKFYSVLKYRYELYKDSVPKSVEQARDTMNNELVITFPCPNPPPNSAEIRITTALVHWEPPDDKIGRYVWDCEVEENSIKKMTCTNGIMFNLDLLLPETNWMKETSNVSTFYHEWLHSQLLIDAMYTPEWRAKFCQCEEDFGPVDENHLIIPALDGNFLKELERIMLHVEDFDKRWNYHGTPEDADGDGTPNSEDQCPKSFDLEGVSYNDSDLDGAYDYCDNCAQEYNPGQEDYDLDGLGDACETDNCYEQDNGDYTVRGRILGRSTYYLRDIIYGTKPFPFPRPSYNADLCSGYGTLIEYYCDGRYVQHETVDCHALGYFSCMNGACVNLENGWQCLGVDPRSRFYIENNETVQRQPCYSQGHDIGTCQGGQCVYKEKWVCKNSRTIAWQLSNGSLINEQNCAYGCWSYSGYGRCNPSPGDYPV